MIRKLFLLILPLASLFVSCKSSGISGEWQLIEYCYGKECINVTDHGIVQYWILSNTNPDNDSVVISNYPCKLGRQFQDSIMDINILWSVSTNNDTLFTTHLDGKNPDTLYITYLEKDTLVLSSMLNNILVTQRFLRL